MSTQSSNDTAQTGRPVYLEPTAPGFWTTLCGAVLAVLAPLLGFLIGSTMGTGETDSVINPLFMGLFIGVIIGGVGVAIALLGGVRMYRASQDKQGDN